MRQTCGSIVFIVLFALAGVVVAGLPVVVWIVYSQCDFITTNTHCEAQIGWLIASCFVGVTLPISIWEIIMHLRYMHSPMLQVEAASWDIVILVATHALCPRIQHPQHSPNIFENMDAPDGIKSN